MLPLERTAPLGGFGLEHGRGFLESLLQLAQKLLESALVLGLESSEALGDSSFKSDSRCLDAAAFGTEQDFPDLLEAGISRSAGFQNGLGHRVRADLGTRILVRAFA
jgi:hypothetical protein